MIDKYTKYADEYVRYIYLWDGDMIVDRVKNRTIIADLPTIDLKRKYCELLNEEDQSYRSMIVELIQENKDLVVFSTAFNMVVVSHKTLKDIYEQKQKETIYKNKNIKKYTQSTCGIQ